MASWIERIVSAIEPIDALVENLRADRIVGVLWIAVLGRPPMSTPAIAADLVESVSKLGLRIFRENYSTWDGEGDAPPKIWLPETAVSSTGSDAI